MVLVRFKKETRFNKGRNVRVTVWEEIFKTEQSAIEKSIKNGWHIVSVDVL